MKRVLLLAVVLLVAVTATTGLGSSSPISPGLVVVVLSQHNQFHISQTESRVQSWRTQLTESSIWRTPVILTSHNLELAGAAWTVVPLFTKLLEYKEADWFLILSEHTQVNFSALKDVLSSYDPSQQHFLGHALSDTTQTILHHFASAGFIQYPCLPAGIVLSRPALQRAAEYLQDFNVSFNIDAQYELALFLKYHHVPPVRTLITTPPPAPPTTALILTPLPQLCVATPPTNSSCVSAFSHQIPECPDQEGVELSEVHFAVKTCSKFHALRLPVVQKTWAPEAGRSIVYYSEEESEEYSTVDIGVANTERGHCGKTFAIIKNFHTRLKSGEEGLKWLVIADDDTLLSVPRLLRLLRCYNHTHQILLGEVYGHGAQYLHGTSYVTGGGGMVLSAGAVTSLLQSSHHCPADNYADDMFLGAMAKILHWDLVHSPLFHQSQPSSYPSSILALQTAISFHRHYPTDPHEIYRTYLQEHAQQETGEGRGSEETTLQQEAGEGLGSEETTPQQEAGEGRDLEENTQTGEGQGLQKTAPSGHRKEGHGSKETTSHQKAKKGRGKKMTKHGLFSSRIKREL